MKRFVLIVLVAGVVAHQLSFTGAYLLYRANRSYIISQLCGQRQVPGTLRLTGATPTPAPQEARMPFALRSYASSPVSGIFHPPRRTV